MGTWVKRPLLGLFSMAISMVIIVACCVFHDGSDEGDDGEDSTATAVRIQS